MRFVASLLTVAGILLVQAAPLQARQFPVNEGGRTYVAHTRRAPVVLHRVLPPFRGIHVYQPGR